MPACAQVMTEAAGDLVVMHQAQPPLVHGDIKSSNVVVHLLEHPGRPDHPISVVAGRSLPCPCGPPCPRITESMLLIASHT